MTDRLYEVLVDIRELLKEIRDGLGASGGVGIVPTLVAPIKPQDWEEVCTEEDVTINPGQKKVVLEVKDSGYLWEVGVNDETYTTYYLLVDEAPVGDPLPQPWGLYNDPYRFPQPIEFDSSIVVMVERHSDAPGPADYYAKVRYVKK
ncbi:MAG: hypothetical protein ACXQS2_01020 [Methermicoccaceae archaeon]